MPSVRSVFVVRAHCEMHKWRRRAYSSYLWRGSRRGHAQHRDYHSWVHSAPLLFLTLLGFTVTTSRLYFIFGRFVTKAIPVSRLLWYCARFLILFVIIVLGNACILIVSIERKWSCFRQISMNKSHTYCWVKTTSYRRHEKAENCDFAQTNYKRIWQAALTFIPLKTILLVLNFIEMNTVAFFFGFISIYLISHLFF